MGCVKLLHTADWHAGRSLHGVDRTPEIREALREIAELAAQEAVDLILVAGDLFDSRNPSAAAEEAVYEFFTTTGAAGIPSVVIAGNHDSPGRLDAVRRILRLASVHAVGQPLVAGAGGAFELEAGGERVRIAALPFVSERRLVRVAELLDGDAGSQRQSYAQSMRRLIRNLTAGFDDDALNLLLMHTTMEGAALANSEYVFHSTESYTLSPDMLPDSAHYVALGHIHKPQGVQGLPDAAARYPGSLLQLDFGEQGDTKEVLLLEARPGRPTELLQRVPIRAGRRLRRETLDEDALERRTPELAEFDGWLKLSLRLDAPRPGLKDRIRAALPNVLAVETLLPEVEAEDGGVDVERIGLVEAYGQYHRARRGEGAPDELVDAFRALLEHVHDEDADDASAAADEASADEDAGDAASDVDEKGAEEEEVRS